LVETFGQARPILARAFSVVNIHLMRAGEALRWRSQAAISLVIGRYLGRYPLPWFLFFGPPVRGLSFGPWRTSAFHVGTL